MISIKLPRAGWQVGWRLNTCTICTNWPQLLSGADQPNCAYLYNNKKLNIDCTHDLVYSCVAVVVLWDCNNYIHRLMNFSKGCMCDESFLFTAEMLSKIYAVYLKSAWLENRGGTVIPWGRSIAAWPDDPVGECWRFPEPALKWEEQETRLKRAKHHFSTLVKSSHAQIKVQKGEEEGTFTKSSRWHTSKI